MGSPKRNETFEPSQGRQRPVFVGFGFETMSMSCQIAGTGVSAEMVVALTKSEEDRGRVESRIRDEEARNNRESKKLAKSEGD